MQRDGMNYVPDVKKPEPVVQAGEFVIAAIALDHGHINGMCQALMEAGATLKWVYDRDPEKMESFVKRFPGVRAAGSEEEILNDPEVKMVCGAAIPNERCALGIRVMRAGKDYFTDKCPLTTLKQLEDARKAVRETGRKYMCYYGERLHSEASVFAGYLIEQGAIGRVIQVIGMGPHRETPGSRPEWFYKKEQYGGILCDIGSHQIEQFLYFTGAEDAKVVSSRIANYAHPDQPELDDFGDCTLTAENGASGYFRVDWFTPDGLRSWGDGRIFLLGTEGYIELRKTINIGTKEETGNHVFLVNREGEHYWNVTGQVGTPFFGELILDCLHRTENAMTQDHCFKAAELCVRAQIEADKLA
ncbi:MAG: Gfo/Idh/MocA family oxidoreductase [Clostridia bacterium]|nr:Gfo/Idh/MocA family oxidoreductase [Clostridia bacterium]